MAVEKDYPWGSIHSTDGWHAQLARVIRWQRRLKSASDPHDSFDFLISLFQNCFHLRDWIPKDEISKETVKSFIDENVEMRICRDVCNMTKHFELRDPPSQEFEPSILREYRPSGQSATFETNSRLVILSRGVKHDALKIANRCVSLWIEFLPSTNTT